MQWRYPITVSLILKTKSPLCRGGGVREKIHDFQRTGGIQERFKKLDAQIGKVLLGGRTNNSPHGPGVVPGDVELSNSPIKAHTTPRRSAGETLFWDILLRQEHYSHALLQKDFSASTSCCTTVLHSKTVGAPYMHSVLAEPMLVCMQYWDTIRYVKASPTL